MLRVGSLFAGIGGFDLAAAWLGWKTVWYSEIEPYACRIMAQRFPEAVNLGDITALTNPPPVDILCGGFPCQDISAAGKGSGITGERSGLWKEYARIIGGVRPRWVVIENSPNLRNKGLEVVLQDLWALGYDAEWHCIPASAVGAPHQRDRIWIVAYAHTVADETERGECASVACEGAEWGYDRGGSACHAWGEVTLRGTGQTPHVADAIRAGLEELARDGVQGDEPGREHTGQDGPVASSGVLHREHAEGWWLSEPDVGRVAHGVPARVDRLRCLGNAVVPLIPYLIFQAIADIEREKRSVTAP